MSLTRFSLVGLAVALVGAAARDAVADPLNITTATTTPVATATANNGPGDISISSSGSIAITAGQTAVTVNSNHDVSNGGTISSNDADNVTGILLQGGFAGPLAIVNTGSISLLESYVQADSDNDGNLDGQMAQGTNRHGIWLQPGADFTGDIANGGTIRIEGNDSAGIRLDARLVGDLTSGAGSVIAVTGDNTVGVAINGGAAAGVDGDVRIAAAITARGENTVGVLVDAPITGALNFSGSWVVTGYNDLVRPTTQAGLDALDPDDQLQSGAAMHVRSSVGGGITIEGIGVEDDEDDDGDGITTGDTDDNFGASIRVFGEGPALLVESTAGAPLVIGATPSGFGINVRGLLEVQGVYSGVDATAIRLEGLAGAGVSVAGGMQLDNIVRATSYEADSYAVYVGSFVDLPHLRIRGTVESGATSDEAIHTAYGVYLTSDANVPQLTNTGSLVSTLYGELGTANAITDLSNTLATINNSGEIVARLIPTDEDVTDDVFPVATGPTVAIDLSASTINVTLNQTPDVPFTDDDTVDNDASVRPATRIVGDVLFGSGADTINLLAGSILGNVAFGAGADVFNIDDGATYVGQLTDSDGQLTLNVQDGTMVLTGGNTNITSATFGADSELRVLLSNVLADSTTIIATGDVTFEAGAVVRPLVPNGLPVSGSHTFLTAGGVLNGASNVTGIVTGAGAPYIYNLEVAVNAVDPNALDAIYTLKTAGEMGMTANQGAALGGIIDALRTSTSASVALASLADADSFFDAYEDLMPSFSSAAAELAATAIQQQQSAASNRLASTRLQGLNEVSVWGQEIGYMVTREPPTANGQAYDGHGFGFALGIDGPLDNGALFGLALSFVTSEVEEDGRPDGEIAATFGQINAYLGTAVGAIDLDIVGGVGGGKLSSRRFIEIGSAFSEIAEGEWWAYEGHLAVRGSMPLKLNDWLTLTPQAALTYVAMQEEGYEEEGGSVTNFEVGEAFSQRLWGDVGFELSSAVRLRGNGVVAPRLFVGYRANLIDEAAERDFTPLAGGAPAFTLQDEPYGDGAPIVGLGIDASNGYSTFSLSYEGEFGDQIERHSVNAAVRFRF
ncbi:MAG TPA: autotransporter domain-containing protein [Terricaulis sp.]|nr:autotransporter domain-containing protein [Terricaulis sp.]